jgi:hypothetical protein
LGFKVAHTAYTQSSFEKAQIIADTPIFSDFPLLDKYYPNSKFIYLERDLNLWIPSIKQLLQRMHRNITRDDGGFNPYIKRCYQQVFYPFTLENILDNDFLTHCYNNHREEVIKFFSNRGDDLLRLDISNEQSLNKLHSFLDLPEQYGSFKKVNTGGKVTAWKEVKSPFKVESTHHGRITTLEYLTK